MPINYEIESVFVIFGECSKEILTEIAAIKSIDKFELIPEPSELIHDTYFDTEAKDLQKAGIGLRIRDVDKKNFITLKADSSYTEWGAVKRVEIENAWEDQKWHEIAAYLNSEIENINFISDCRESEILPASFFKKIGFEVIQRRKNKRLVRSIIASNNKIGELVLDSLYFNLNQIDFVLYEVEIEMYGTSFHSEIKLISAMLHHQYSSFLMFWKYSKLATCLAIEKLLGNGNFENTLHENFVLSKDSFLQLEEFFEK